VVKMLGSTVIIHDYAEKIECDDKYCDAHFDFALKFEDKCCKENSKGHDHKGADNDGKVLAKKGSEDFNCWYHRKKHH